MSDYDYEIDDIACPQCGWNWTHSRPCTGLFCDDGMIDEHEDDPVNFAPGEAYVFCDECHGTGIERWCPECGHDLQADRAATEHDDD